MSEESSSEPDIDGETFEKPKGPNQKAAGRGMPNPGEMFGILVQHSEELWKIVNKSKHKDNMQKITEEIHDELAE